MKELRKSEKILAGAVLALVLIFSVNQFIVKPLSQKFSSTEDDVSRLKLAIRKYSELDREKDRLLSEYERVRPYLKLTGSDEEKQAAILSRIETEARNSGITILDMRPELLKKPKAVSLLCNVQLNAEADLGKIVAFVCNLENAPILLKIEKLNLSVKDESKGLLRFEVSIVAVAFS